MNKCRKISISFLGIITTIIIVLYFIKIDTGKFCCEYGLVKWKFAIYYYDSWKGEGGDGTYVRKLDKSGWKEYFGLKEIKCPCEQTKNDTEKP